MTHTIDWSRGRRALLRATAFVALGTSCNTDKLLVEHPKDVIVAENLFQNTAGFDAALNALYNEVRRERLGVGETNNDLLQIAMAVGTDNAFVNYSDPPSRLFQDYGVAANPTVAFYRDLWNLMYETINGANTIIGRAENPAVRWTATTDKARVVAEAKLFRAWAYRHLTYLFGDVPLNLEESTGANIRTDWDRTPRDSVRKVVVADLLDAEANLPATAADGRLTKAVAQHYLAEMYLALNNLTAAETKALAVTTNASYKLVTARYGVKATQPGVAFMDMFQDGNSNRSQGNTEAIWVLQYAENVPGGSSTTTQSNIMRRYWVNRYESNKGMQISSDNGGRGLGRVAITKWAISRYEPQDVRGGIYAIRRFYLLNNPATLPTGKKLGDTLFTVFNAEKLSDPLWPSTRKWDWASATDPLGGSTWNDQVYIRLAETLLLQAEAQFKLGKPAEAAAAINLLRARAGATPVTTAQVTLDFILDERSRELLTEEQRRYTLLRTGTWYDRVRLYNPLAAVSVQPRDSLYPVPQTVIDANLTKKMAQNPGY